MSKRVDSRHSNIFQHVIIAARILTLQTACRWNQKRPSLKECEVVSLIAIVLNFLRDLAGANPSDMILHGASHMERWVCDGIDADFDMALLDIHDSILDCLSHLHFLHQDWKSAPSERTHCDLLTRGQTLSSVDDGHVIKFHRKLLCLGHPVVILLTQCLQLGHELCDLTD